MNTTKLNNTTKKASNWIGSYNRANYYSVEDFYKNPSCNKIRAERYCLDRMNEINGHGYRILGGNSSFFTCGYMSQDNKTLYIETACNTFEIAL